MGTETNFDVIIVGGSYAGLSAAMALGRSLRKVLIIDSGLPCNRQTPHSHNFITNDGEKPAAIAAKAREQVLNYPTVKFVNTRAVSGKRTETGFEIVTEGSQKFNARKLVFATGISDTMPPIKGFAECWGISVVHCPYCHGYELRDRKTVILANGARAFHLASLVSNLTREVIILTQGVPEFSPEELAKLEAHHIPIIETEVSEIQNQNGHVEGIIFSSGRKLAVEAIYAAVPFTQHSDIPTSLGCDLAENGYIKIDNFQKTTVPGVYACGDNSAMMRSVANAVYTGNLAGAMVNKELVDDEF